MVEKRSRTSNRRRNKAKRRFWEYVEKNIKNEEERIAFFIKELWESAKSLKFERLVLILEAVNYYGYGHAITIEYTKIMGYVKGLQGENDFWRNFFWESPYKLRPINKLAFHEITPYSVD